MKSNPRIAFVIDSLPSLGGAEKVLFTALEIYPQADIFTLIYNKEVFKSTPVAEREIKTSYLDRFPLAHRHHRMFLPLMPAAIERFNLQKYDLIVSFSYAVAHGVHNFNGARHVSYTYTPMRYAWTDINLDGTHTNRNIIVDKLLQAFCRWDRKAAARVHQFAAVSQAVSRRIQSAYQREAPVIYPPVEVDRFQPNGQREDYYVTVSRLVPHKRIDLLVEAFTELNLPLLIIGDGAELPRLRALAGSNIRFLGYQTDESVIELMSKARGFVCAAEEDFGIAIVEAQAAGCPVIVYGRGGALETVLDGTTGVLFSEQTKESLIEAILQFERIHSSFCVDDLVQQAKRFDKTRFIDRFVEFVEPTM
ncbi:MAG TPA: glycosyltransferase [Anaerolineales bacterium]|nr:glycosyltransferase [Anaerolineales bacterium]